jgi:hypothetical protein
MVRYKTKIDMKTQPKSTRRKVTLEELRQDYIDNSAVEQLTARWVHSQ